MPGAPYRVVFSYSRIDSDFVLKTASALRRDGVNLWVDQLDIPKGARWDEAVEGAVKDCSCMLVVLSPDSVNSPNVLDEVYYALETKKKVVPVVIRPCEIPFRLKRIQHIDFTGDEDSAYSELLAAVAGPQADEQLALPIAAQGGSRFHFPGKVFHLGLAAPSADANRANAAGHTDAGWRPPRRRFRLRDAALGATAGVFCLLVAAKLAGWPPFASKAPVVTPAQIEGAGSAPSSSGVAPAAGGADPAARKLDAQLRGFISEYIALHNRGNVADIMKLYSDKVAYNDEAVDKKFVLEKKTDFYKKWSHVVYRMVEEPTITLSEDGQLAHLKFSMIMMVEFGGNPSQAKVRQHLVVRRMGDEWKIVSERLRVLDKPYAKP
jgi:ketosteroid isomerase-like protein